MEVTGQPPTAKRRRGGNPSGHRAAGSSSSPVGKHIVRARRRWLMAGGSALALVTVGSFSGSRLVASRLFIPQVRAAVAETNTWHFSGWRRVANKRVPWEIWGRRLPFFYREQIGDSLLIATDKQQFRLMPPADHQPGMALVTPGSVRERRSLSDGPESFIDGIGGEFIGRMSQIGSSGNSITLRSRVNRLDGVRQLDEWEILAIDTQTRLPTHYELYRAGRGVRADASKRSPEFLTSEGESNGIQAATLTAHYNIALPSGIDTAPTPPGYAEVNLLPTPVSAPSIPREGTVSSNGITIHAKVTEADRDGNLHLRFTGWLGRQRLPVPGQPIDIAVDPISELAVAPMSKFGRAALRDYLEGLTDEQGTAYVALPSPVDESVEPEWYLIPIEPLPAQHPRPRQLTAHANIGASWYPYLPDADTGVPYSLAQAEVTLTIPLARPVTALDYDTRPSSGGVAVSPRLPLQAAAARARVQYYIGLSHRTDGMGGPLRHAAQLRALYWIAKEQQVVNRLPSLKRALQEEIDSSTEHLDADMHH